MTDLLPLTLLFIFGGFAALSATLKVRGRVTGALGIVLTVLEGLSGVTLMVVSLPGSGSLGTASMVAMATVVLVAFSSTVHLMKVRERSRAREASEAKRLYAAVQYPVDAGPDVTEGGPPGLDLATGVGPPGPDLAADLGDGSDRPEGGPS